MILSSPLTQSPPLIKTHLLKPKRGAVTVTFAATCTTTTTTTSAPKLASSSATSFYELLGIQMGATSEEIKAAYRRQARVCHPDVVAIDRKDTSTDEFMRIHAAYSTLSDPEKRADYDRRLLRRHRSYSSLRASAAPESFNGFSRRNWETDQCW